MAIYNNFLKIGKNQDTKNNPVKRDFLVIPKKYGKNYLQFLVILTRK